MERGGNSPSSPNETTYEYHPYLNTVTKMVLPDGTTQYYDYNYWGQVEEQEYLDSEGQKYGIVTSTYNTIGELLSSTGEDNTGSSYTYNKFGDITQVVDDSGTRTFTYDTAGRLTNESGSNGNKAYTYDGNGNRTSFSLVQDNQTIQEQTYVYDRLNRLTQVKDSNNNILASYTYDDNSNLTTETKGEDVVTQYTYNYGSQLTGKTNVVSGTVISDYDYTYYMDGNIKTENNRTFTYDNLGRLKQEQDGTDTISYTYDRFGNRSSMNNSGVVTSYTYDLNNRLLQENSGNKTTFYNYDDRGNLYSKRTDETSSATDLLRVDFFGELKNNSDSTVEMYFYNGLNRLKEVRKGGITAQYTYNAEGIRTSKTVNGVTTAFYLDGANVIAETKNNETTNYVRGVSGIVHSEVLGSSNSRKYYTSDGHGNITNLINTSGTVVKTYDYDVFGVEENIDSADTNPFRYCGEYYDSEINQIYLRARYYDPSIGRFTQSDPIRDGLNWYVYCGNNPVNLVDPTGKWGEDVHYDDTLKWAMEVGFSEEDAETIAYYDNYTDNIFSGISPFNLSNQTYHFDRDPSDVDTRIVHAKENLNHAIWQKKQAVKNYNLAMAALNPNDEAYGRKKQEIEYQYQLDKAYALEFLGKGLHALQDVDAHGQIGADSQGFASHLSEETENADNKNYDWVDSSCTRVEYSGKQIRYQSTKNWSKWYLSMYLSDQSWD